MVAPINVIVEQEEITNSTNSSFFTCTPDYKIGSGLLLLESSLGCAANLFLNIVILYSSCTGPSPGPLVALVACLKVVD